MIEGVKDAVAFAVLGTRIGWLDRWARARVGTWFAFTDGEF